jgi:hypothetical protein
MFWEWKYIEYVLKYFLWKAANLLCTFDKRELLLFEEFELVRKNNYFGTLFIRPNVSLAV